jgi:hypothetical protein
MKIKVTPLFSFPLYFMGERTKILASRNSNACAKHHRFTLRKTPRGFGQDKRELCVQIQCIFWLDILMYSQKFSRKPSSVHGLSVYCSFILIFFYRLSFLLGMVFFCILVPPPLHPLEIKRIKSNVVYMLMKKRIDREPR